MGRDVLPIDDLSRSRLAAAGRRSGRGFAPETGFAEAGFPRGQERRKVVALRGLRGKSIAVVMESRPSPEV